jgi:regulator of protease activity HflC (stomatin/prohibitin superfamily)
MAERDVRERDILVASNEYAYVQDLTKGDIVLYVGPTKISLSNTERLVEFRNDRFVPVRGEDGGIGVSPFISATSAQYVVLENPAKEANVKPVKGSNSSIELLPGRRVVVQGPVMFPLWPGQRARVINGHELYEDQYLRVRVYDKVDGDAAPIGAERIIKGSEVRMYMPRTGLEVLPDEKGFVRNAVTLLDGQFCILRGPQGRRRYVRGPAVVFPEAWEEFLVKNGTRTFSAVPLKKDRGLHVRAVKAFEAKAGDQVPVGKYHAGQELFLKDTEGYFFPTEELEVLGEVSALQLAEREAVYVRDIQSGKVTTVIGPAAFLPDPTRVQIVSRPLSPEVAARYGITNHNPARAPAIYIPPSYAVLVTAKSRREVVRGPQVRILDFDEDLEVLWLSTGTPKSDASLLGTCFLNVDGNKVSDKLSVRTSDHVELAVRLSYRVSFTSKQGADDARWFNVNNYVALLCDHLGSITRAAVRSCPIERFHAGSTDVIRSAILGDKKADKEKRTGREFEENGMLVYDVEVLEVSILDEDVEELLTQAQRSAITAEVEKKREALRLANEQAREMVNRAIFDAQRESLGVELALEGARRTLACARAEAKSEATRLEVVGRAENEAQALEVTSTARAAAQARDAELAEKALKAQSEAFRTQMQAMHPELVATLKSLGNQELAGRLTQHLGPLAILGGESVADVAAKLLAGMPVGVDGDAASTVKALLPGPKKKGA